MSSFYTAKNNDNTFRVECRLVVYREKLGKHPDFLKPTGDKATGYNTKYFLLIEDDISSESTANDIAAKYASSYDTLIEKCEESGDWTDFPFKDRAIIFYK